MLILYLFAEVVFIQQLEIFWFGKKCGVLVTDYLGALLVSWNPVHFSVLVCHKITPDYYLLPTPARSFWMLMEVSPYCQRRLVQPDC